MGCGTASTLHYLQQQWGESVTLHGIDPSADMLAVAAKKVNGASQVHLAVGAGEVLEFDDESFDWVISCLTPHHLPEQARCQMLAECYRVLKGNGRFLISDFGVPVNIFAQLATKLLWRHHAFVAETLQGEIFQQAEEAGFQIIDRQIQWGGIYHVLAQKALGNGQNGHEFLAESSGA